MNEFISIVLASFIATFLSAHFTDLRWEKQAIVHECGIYNTQTKDFEWIENEKP